MQRLVGLYEEEFKQDTADYLEIVIVLLDTCLASQRFDLSLKFIKDHSLNQLIEKYIHYDIYRIQIF